MTCKALESEPVKQLLDSGFHVVETSNQSAYLVLQKGCTQAWIDKKTCLPVVIDHNVRAVATGGGSCSN